MKTKLLFYWLILAAIGLSISSCAPVFSEMQSARMVGKGGVEVIPSYSTASGKEEDSESEKLQNHVGLQMTFGLSDNADLRLRYEYIWLKDEDLFDSEGTSVIGFGPKVSIINQKLAFALTAGRALGENSEDSWQLHPTLLGTLPLLKDKVEFTVAPKYMFTFCEDCDDYVAVNFGLSLSSNLNKWAVRPEFGLCYVPGEKGHYSQFSIGVSRVLNR